MENKEMNKFKKIGNNCTFAEMVHIQEPGLVTIGDNVRFYRGVYIETNGKEVVIGSDTHFAPYGVLYGPLEIGKQCAVAAHVVFASIGQGYGEVNVSFVEQAPTSEKIIVEDNVWIGTNAVITQGVRIGTGSIIGAGAVVTRDVEPYSIMGGVPARLIRKRNE